jgi:hypothetical protein
MTIKVKETKNIKLPSTTRWEEHSDSLVERRYQTENNPHCREFSLDQWSYTSSNPFSLHLVRETSKHQHKQKIRITNITIIRTIIVEKRADWRIRKKKRGTYQHERRWKIQDWVVRMLRVFQSLEPIAKHVLYKIPNDRERLNEKREQKQSRIWYCNTYLLLLKFPALDL